MTLCKPETNSKDPFYKNKIRVEKMGPDLGLENLFKINFFKVNVFIFLHFSLIFVLFLNDYDPESGCNVSGSGS